MSVFDDIDETVAGIVQDIAAMRGLVTSWREQEAMCFAQAGDEPASFDEVEWDAMGAIYRDCADELERVLNGGSASGT